MKFLTNPREKKRASPAQMRARRKFAAMARARATTARHNPRKRATTTKRKAAPVARKRKRATIHKRRRTTTRRSPVTSLRRRSVYVTNPRRRRRAVARRAARRYHRNPSMGRQGLVGQAIGLVKDTGMVMAGAAAGNFISGLIPLAGSPVVNFAKGTVVAMGIRVFGGKFLGTDLARLASIGAMMAPTKALIVTYFPTFSPYLSEGMLLPGFPGAQPSLRAYAPLGDYNQDYYDADDGTTLSSYAESYQN